MKIRSITYFVNPGWPLEPEALAAAGRFIRAAKPAFEAAGYAIQTTRLATVPFPPLPVVWDPDEAILLAQDLESAAQAEGFDTPCLFLKTWARMHDTTRNGMTGKEAGLSDLCFNRIWQRPAALYDAWALTFELVR